jgi:hypothetical protein
MAKKMPLHHNVKLTKESKRNIQSHLNQPPTSAISSSSSSSSSANTSMATKLSREYSDANSVLLAARTQVRLFSTILYTEIVGDVLNRLHPQL